ncbi:hypothetical protein LN996_13155 [Arthrobacter sp. AK01]|uniref:DUF7507 domain-containing protein n=1 Tax=Arthrobacter sp. AK01 TaxID=2894084 RepID=UPI001E5A7457|nr:hypothetical protein [Arthrobacter sp. AK01]MCD4851763.1 hypothetical protein [Arthrobacter sp. AK01]
MKHARSQKLLAAVAAAAIMSLWMGGAVAPPVLATTPGTPGVAQPGTPVYTEDFSNQNATAGAISILNYAGGPAAANEMYTADTPYTPAGGQCDGWILNSLTPLPTSDTGCLRNQPDGWGQIQQMSTALGLAQGQTAAQAASNQSLSEYTNSASGIIAPGVQFRTKANTIPAIAGHYYAVSGYFAQVNCHAAHASETFSLLINGTRQVLSTGLDPCGGSNLAKVQVTKLQSAAYQIPAGTTPSLGLELRNEATTGSGNDVAFDLPQIVDVTPQVDKAFTPSIIGPGGISKVTLTVTNTDDLKAKNDWFITDTLPAGVVVAGTPNIGGTCVQASGTNPLVRTAVAGSNTISVAGGDMALGMTSCTITVDVTAAEEGTYVNGPANIATNLNPPANATLIVRAPRLQLTKALDAPRLLDSDQFTVEIRTGSATGPIVSNTANATTTGTGSTVTAGTGMTGEYVANANATYFLTESGGANLASYDSAITCLDANGLQAELPNGDAFDGSLDLVPVAGADISCVLTNTAVPAPEMEFSKSADSSGIRNPSVVGDRITYTFTSRNTGNVPLTGVTINDPLDGLSALTYTWPGTPGTLLPGETVTAMATYAITQADIGAGHIANLATTTGNPPTGPPVTPPPAATDTPLTPGPAMEFSKSADASGIRNPSVVGDRMTYTFTSANTGNVKLTGVVIDDPLAGLSALVYTWPGTPGELLPGQAVTATATYAITQADIEAGHVANSATTTGTPPTGPPVTPPPAGTDTPLTPGPAMEFSKTADASAIQNPSVAGDLMTYTFTSANTGNVALTNVAINDPLVGLSPLTYAWPGTPGELLPGQAVTATATYAITQADIDAGHVANRATTTGTPPTGPPVTPPPGTTYTPLTPKPAMEFSKSADASAVQDPSTSGDVITYAFSTKNTGNVTLKDVAITDPLAGLSALTYTWPGVAGTLLPGETVTATATYAITQADIDAGHVANSATTTGTPPTGPAFTPPPGETDTALITAPAMEFSKTAVAPAIDRPSKVGDVITYDFTARNTGNVKLANVSITDPLAGLSALTYTWPGVAGTLMPGETVTATATYAITQADIDAGHVANSATTTGTPPAGPPVGPPPGETDTPLTPDSGVEFTKTADASAVGDPTQVGDIITYKFKAKNTGNVPITDVAVNDLMPGLSDLAYVWPGAAGTLLPGQMVTATATYAITQADINAGRVANSATVTGTPPTGPPVTTPPASVVVTFPPVVPNQSGGPLANTGVVLTVLPISLLVVGSGLFLFLVGRRQRSEA